MKKFSEYMAERKKEAPAPAPVSEAAAPGAAPSGAKDYYTLLEEFGVKSVLDLDEAKFNEFHEKLVTVLNEATK